MVRQVVHSILLRKGFIVYDVALCVRPESADCCEVECAGRSSPDLMVIEVLVPRSCTGIQVARKALRRWPNVKVLLTSASPRELWPSDSAHELAGLLGKSCAFLPKPFTSFQLEDAIARLLRASS